MPLQYRKKPQNEYIPNVFEVGRYARILKDFFIGFHFLRQFGLAATFFGSARCTLEHATYQDARTLAGMLSKDGFTIITGGGPGIMEAANHGAKEVGGHSIGLNIELPNEQHENPHLTAWRVFHYFFTRKVLLSFASEVYIFFPGGFGTLDELFEVVTLIQTKKMQPIPVILVGKEFWAPLMTWARDSLAGEHKTIDGEDMEIFHVVDSPQEAYARIHELLPVEEMLKNHRV